MNKLSVILFIVVIVLAVLCSGCCIKEKIIYLSNEEMVRQKMNNRMNNAFDSLQNTGELREWFFVNENKLYTCGFMGSQDSIIGGCRAEEFLNYTTRKELYKNWFSHYISFEKLEKKWKDKSMPEYLKKAYQNNQRIEK